MAEVSKLTVIENDFVHEFNLHNQANIKQTYLLIPTSNLNTEVVFNVASNTNLSIKVIAINYNQLEINAKFDINLVKDNNNCEIEMLCYGFDKSKSKIVSNVSVNQQTIKNKSLQKITGVLLSGECKIVGEPNLKIDALNVDAKHKLNIGSLDKNEIFYLMSKGIDKNEAKKIIINSYLISLLDSLNEQEKKFCLKKVQERFG